MARDLETPADPRIVFTALGEDVDEFRPLFTGDVYKLQDARLVMILQHPCALRRGVELVPRILVAEVRRAQSLPVDWAAGHFKVMPLSGLLNSQEDYAASFTNIDLVGPSDLEGNNRIAVLSLAGVNLLLQRWVHHNSRVVIPTFTYAEETIGPFEEADLAAEWCMERDGKTSSSPMNEFDTWIREPTRSGTRQAMLTDNQKRSVVRRDMKKRLKELREESGQESADPLT